MKHFIKTALVLASSLLISAAPYAAEQGKAATSDTGIAFITTDALKSSGLPLSSAVEVDGWVYLSGALGTAPGKGLVKGGIKPETRQTMENIQALLADMNLGMESIVKCTVMLADMAEWPAFNAIYKTFFANNYPARSAFATAGLALNARVEIECMAKR